MDWSDEGVGTKKAVNAGDDGNEPVATEQVREQTNVLEPIVAGFGRFAGLPF
jgi:hypothetical protein